MGVEALSLEIKLPMFICAHLLLDKNEFEEFGIEKFIFLKFDVVSIPIIKILERY